MRHDNLYQLTKENNHCVQGSNRVNDSHGFTPK